MASTEGAVVIRRHTVLGNPFEPPPPRSRGGRRLSPAESRRYRRHCMDAYEALLHDGADAAVRVAAEHGLSSRAAMLTAEAAERRDTEIRRLAHCVAAGARVDLRCTHLCADGLCHGEPLRQRIMQLASEASAEEVAAAREAAAAWRRPPAQSRRRPTAQRSAARRPAMFVQ